MNLIAELHRVKLDPTLRSLLAARLKQSEDDAAQLKRLSEQSEIDALELKQLNERTQHDAVELKQLNERINQDSAYIKAANLKIAALTLELAHRKRIQFGSKSEAFTPEQRELFQETEVTDIAAMEAELEAVAEQIAPMTGKAKKPLPTGRQALPAHLPRIEDRHEPDTCTCDACGAELVKIGEDVSEQLDVEPARFFVHRHIRPQYACRTCETVIAQAIPPAVIQGSLGAPGLHAWVAVHLSPFAGEIYGSFALVSHRTNQ